MTRAKAPRSRAALVVHAARVGEGLALAVPEARCELDFNSPFELLIATILSAQTTDKGVNKVTPELFRRYPDAASLAAAPVEMLEAIVRPTGFFRVKAKNIRETARLLVERHGGEVPRTIEALVALPGVARKTANVVLGTAFGIASGVTVDTHATRVSQRLALTTATDPIAIEQDLMALYPSASWVDLGHRLVLHGRYTCIARAPRCDGCALRDQCPSALGEQGKGAIADAAVKAPRARRNR